MKSLVAIAIAALVGMASANMANAADPWRYRSIADEDLAPFEEDEAKFLVAVFITTDCPVANYFQPTLRRIQEKYAERGVAFVFFHSDPTVTQESARAHAKDYGIAIPVVLDPDFTFAKRLGAEVTPEAFVISRDGAVKYRGRVNDMYTDFGKKRRAPRHNDLDDAIGAALDGKEISAPKTKPIGCYIPYPKATKP